MIAALVLSLALGADVKHDAGDPYLELMLEGQMWSVWVATAGVGGQVQYDLGRWRFGAGLEAGPARWEVSTILAYSLRIEYNTGHKWTIGLRHRSNCKSVCRGDLVRWANLGNEGRNTGYNWLYLRRKF